MIVSKPNRWRLLISLLLFTALLPGADRVGCQAPATTLKTELEDLREIKSRLLVDLPAGFRGSRRLMYVENRGGCAAADCGGSECGGPDPEGRGQGGGVSFLVPRQWAVGFSGPLITAGPVCLRGILAQLYNPLAHGPGSDVFTESPELSLNIDLDVGRRSGVQLGLVPGHWSLLCVHEKQTGAQLGSALAMPLGGSLELALVGLLSAPANRLESEQSWYPEGPLFPGGPITHWAGSLTWGHDPLRLALVAASSAGRRAEPGTFLTLDMSLSAAPADLALLLGYCSPRFFTPEGDTADLEWIAAARADGDFGRLHLSAACSRELCPLPPIPEGFRGCRDRFEAGIGFVRKSSTRWVWSIEGEAALRREWSAGGRESSFRCLEAGSTWERNAWSFTVGMSESRDGESQPVRDAGVAVGHDPGWGGIELEAGYRHSPIPALDLAAALDVIGENKRFYIRAATIEVLPLLASGESRNEWPELFTLRLGWEASVDRRPREP